MTDKNTAVAERPMSRAKRAELDARDRFLADAGEHPMTVLHDDGLYRHLSFSRPGSLDRFEVITWPGHLTINGGHGTWTFSRTEDMLEFFRTSRGLTRINPSYWGEKLRGGLVSGNALTEEYDADLFLETVRQHVDDFAEGSDWPDEVIDDLRTEIALQVTDDSLDWTHEAVARDLLDQFSFRTASRRFQFEDAWEWDLCRPSFHFLWSCWAVAYAVAEYDRQVLTPFTPRVHNHPPYRPVCNERDVDGQLRGACLNDDGSDR